MLSLEVTGAASSDWVTSTGENSWVKLYRDDAVVLRTHKLAEADRIVTLLTREHGKVRAVVKGVRRSTSKFGARLEPFQLVDVQLYAGRNLDIVTQAVTIDPLAKPIVGDYRRYTVASAIAETADRLVDAEHEPAIQQFWLLVGALRALGTGAHAPTLILDSYLLRSLAVAGYAPSFVDCARCGEPGPHTAFNVAAGGAVCNTCRPPGSAAPAATTFELLGALLAGNWAVADASTDRDQREASGLVAAFTQYHLERGLRSLPIVDRTQPDQEEIA